MVQSNMRLVVSIARKYANVGVNLQDLVQEGSLGLTRAAEKFEPQKGVQVLDLCILVSIEQLNGRSNFVSCLIGILLTVATSFLFLQVDPASSLPIDRLSF